MALALAHARGRPHARPTTVNGLVVMFGLAIALLGLKIVIQPPSVSTEKGVDGITLALSGVLLGTLMLAFVGVWRGKPLGWWLAFITLVLLGLYCTYAAADSFMAIVRTMPSYDRRHRVLVMVPQFAADISIRASFVLGIPLALLLPSVRRWCEVGLGRAAVSRNQPLSQQPG